MNLANLMIGDYVYMINVRHQVDFTDDHTITDKGYDVEKRVIKVESVADTCVHFLTKKFGTETYITVDAEKIEPIEISDELLIYNNINITDTIYHVFDKPTHVFSWKANRDTRTPIIVKLSSKRSDDTRYISIENSIYRYEGEVKYVHELQQIFRHCKLNKVINLKENGKEKGKG
jgi:hypothetical protein